MKYNVIENVVKSLAYENNNKNRLECLKILQHQLPDDMIVCDESNNENLNEFTVDVDGFRYVFRDGLNGFKLYPIVDIDKE